MLARKQDTTRRVSLATKVKQDAHASKSRHRILWVVLRHVGIQNVDVGWQPGPCQRDQITAAQKTAQASVGQPNRGCGQSKHNN